MKAKYILLINIFVLSACNYYLNAQAYVFSNSTSAERAAAKWTRNSIAWVNAPVLDISNFTLTFSDDFNTLDVTTATGAGPWRSNVMPFALTVGETQSFGDARWPDLYTIDPVGNIRLRTAPMWIDGTGNATDTPTGTPANNGAGQQRWVCAHMQTVKPTGQKGYAGFSQQYGYFEARVLMPGTPGTWAAIWFKGVNKWSDYTGNGGTGTETTTEFDLIEYYGTSDLNGSDVHMTTHLWPAPGTIPNGQLTTHWSTGNAQTVRDNNNNYLNLSLDYHLYGAMITPNEIIVYIDRKEMARMPILPEFHQPMYPIITMGVNAATLAANTPNIDMLVDYFKVWQAPSVATGIVETVKYNVSIYPNPASNKITIASNEQETINVFIYNMVGELMLQTQSNQGATEIDISPLSKGMYFYRVSDKNNIVQTDKFIVE